MGKPMSKITASEFRSSLVWTYSDPSFLSGATLNTLSEEQRRLLTIQAALNRWIPAPYYHAGYGVRNAEVLTTVAKIDDYWLPLISTPRQQDYFVRSHFDNVSIETEVTDRYDVVTVTMGTTDVLGGVPVAWYVDYAQEKIAEGAANASELKKAVEDLAAYEGKTITYCELSKAVMLPQDLVKLTTAYRDYAKAKEKACEENDFMEKQFAPGITFGTVNTLINGSRNTRVFYGYRDTADMPVIEGINAYPFQGWVLTVGSSTVAVRRADGTFAPSFTADTAGEFVQAIVGGASVVGGTMESQLALWGLPASDALASIEGTASMSFRIDNSQKGYGTPAALYDFRWGSLGISGYPDYPSVDQQTQYRIAMVSKAMLTSFGTKMRQLQLEEVNSAYVTALFA